MTEYYIYFCLAMECELAAIGGEPLFYDTPCFVSEDYIEQSLNIHIYIELYIINSNAKVNHMISLLLYSYLCACTRLE